MTHAPLPRPAERPLPRFGRRRTPAARREPRLTLPRSALLPARWGRAARGGSLGPWALASLLLHGLILLLFVLDIDPRGRPSDALPPPSFDIVFEGGGAERSDADAPDGVEVPPAPPQPPVPPAAAAPPPPQPPAAAVPPPPAPAPPVPSPPTAQAPPPPPTPQPPVAQAPPLPPPPTPAPPPPPPRQVAEAPRPVSPPPPPPRPEAPPIAEAFPELPTAEQLLGPQTELRLPDRFDLPLPLPPPPTPQAAPQRPPPQQQARPMQPRPDLPGVWAPNGVQVGPQATAPQPPSGRPQGRGLDTRVDPRFLDGRPSADPSVRVTGAQVGADWRAAFRRWLDQNIRYPERAIALGEDGTVRVRVIANPDGTVRSVQLVGPSTSPSLNFGTTFPFQGARLPAFPPPADPNGVTIDLTVNYILIRR